MTIKVAALLIGNCTITGPTPSVASLYNAHTHDPLSDLIGRDCLTPQGDRVTVELIATDENLPPHFIVTRFVYLRITVSYSKHP